MSPSPTTEIFRIAAKAVRILMTTLAVSLAGSFLQAEIPFAEDLFPELTDLMYEAAGEGPEVQLGRLRIEEKEGDLEVAKGQRLPRVNMYARLMAAYEWREDIDDRFRGRADASLSVTQPLYHWGSLQRRQAMAEDRVQLEQIESENRALESIMNLRRSYLDWLLVREQKAILQQSIELAQSYLDARTRMLEAGLSSEQDVLEMEAQLLEKHESLARVEQWAVEIESRLHRLVGPSFDPGRIVGMPLSVIQPMDQAAFEALALRVRGKSDDLFNPSLDRLQVLKSIEEQNIQNLDKGHLPTLDLVAGLYSDQIDGINQSDSILRVQSFVGLQVNWNIFDGWQTAGWKRGSMARKRSFALQSELADETARRRAESLLAALEMNLKQIEARGKREAILDRRLQLLNNQADLATITGAELIEAEIDFLHARRSLMEARVDYLSNLMEIGALLGDDPASPKLREDS